MATLNPERRSRTRSLPGVADCPSKWRFDFPKELFFIPYLDGSAAPVSCAKDILTTLRFRSGKIRYEQLASQMVGRPAHSLSQHIQFLLAHHAVGADEELLASVFFTVSSFGFVLELLLLHHPHLGRGLVWPLLLGALAAGTVAARIKRTHLYPLIQLI
jgi:hypothetical protein